MSGQNIFELTGDQAIPGMERLYYDNHHDYRNYWTGFLGDFELYFYGIAEAPPPDRIATAQKVLPLMEEFEQRAATDLKNHFSTGEVGEEWNVIETYFGFGGTEPADEFSLHYWGSIWGGPVYYVQYRLNPDDPMQSSIVKFGSYE